VTRLHSGYVPEVARASRHNSCLRGKAKTHLAVIGNGVVQLFSRSTNAAKISYTKQCQWFPRQIDQFYTILNIAIVGAKLYNTLLAGLYSK
jgi:hypothetical protein